MLPERLRDMPKTHIAYIRIAYRLATYHDAVDDVNHSWRSVWEFVCIDYRRSTDAEWVVWDDPPAALRVHMDHAFHKWTATLSPDQMLRHVHDVAHVRQGFTKGALLERSASWLT